MRDNKARFLLATIFALGCYSLARSALRQGRQPCPRMGDYVTGLKPSVERPQPAGPTLNCAHSKHMSWKFVGLALGLWEVFDAANGHFVLNKTLPPPTFARVVISYDESDMVRGIFGEFDMLPADGHSGPYSWRK